jgi:hypothetical protein
LGNCYPLWQINKSGWVDMFVVGGLANYLAYCAHLYFFHNGKVIFHYLTATKIARVCNIKVNYIAAKCHIRLNTEGSSNWHSPDYDI